MRVDKIFAFVLAVVMLLGLLCACAPKEELVACTVRADVVKFYNLDQAGKDEVARLFTRVDQAMEVLSACETITDEDIMTYANSVFDAGLAFEEIFWENYELDYDGADEDQEAFMEVLGSQSDIRWAAKLKRAIAQVQEGEETPEELMGRVCFIVNKYAQGLLGTDWMSQEQIDALIAKLG